MRSKALLHRSGAVALAILAGACAARTKSAVHTASTSTGRQSTVSTAAGPNSSEVNPSGDIPDTQVYVPYFDPAGGFDLKVPEGWSRTGTNGVVSFTDKLNTVRIESKAAPAAPSVDSASRTEVPPIQATEKNVQAPKVINVSRKAGTAVLITYRADAPPDPVTGKVVQDEVERYEFWRNGTEVILTLSGPTGADNVDPWRTITDSFAWKP